MNLLKYIIIHTRIHTQKLLINDLDVSLSK